MTQLVLSLFPGMDLLGMAFEAEGFCVVRGPEKIFGSDVKNFHPPAGRFEGLIGGPPCQIHSILTHLVELHREYEAEDLVDEFVRCVEEASPAWWLMENVPLLKVEVAPKGYHVVSFRLNNRHLDAGEGFGPEQNRVRKFWFGNRRRKIDLRERIEFAALESRKFSYAVLASNPLKYDNRMKKNGRKLRGGKSICINTSTVRNSLRLQGLPESLVDGTPFKLRGLQRLIGNGVPLSMGRAVAGAIKGFSGELFSSRE